MHNGTGKNYGWSAPLTFSVYNSGTAATTRQVPSPTSDPAVNWTNIQSKLDLGGIIELQQGSYVIDRPLVISNHYTKLIGVGRGVATNFVYASGTITPPAGMTVIRYDYTNCLDEVIRVTADNVDISRIFLMNGHDGGSDAHQIIEIQGKSCSMRYLRVAMYDEREWGEGGPPRDWSSISNDPNANATGATSAYIDDGCVFFNYSGEARGLVWYCDFYTINTGVRIGTLQNSDLTQTEIIPAVRQVTVKNCNFNGQYAGEACRQANAYGSGRAVGVVIYNGREIEITANCFTSAAREQGRLLNRSVLSYNSSTRDVYIADNVTFDCGSADWAEMPDNQGEQYLFHYRYTKGGIFDVVSATSNSVVISTNVGSAAVGFESRWYGCDQSGGGVPNEVGSNDHWVAFIVDGTGVGQYREVESKSMVGADVVLTTSQPWRLPPDSTSRINLFVPMRHIIVYNNEVDCGDVAGTKTHMVSLWNDCVDNVVRGNSGKNLSAGVTVNGCLWAPSAWNLVEDNSFSNMYLFAGTDLTAVTNAFIAFQFSTTRESSPGNTIWPTVGWYGLGNIARYNIGTNAGCGGIMANAYYGQTYGHTDVWENPAESLIGRGMQLCVMEQNSFDDIERGVFADCSTHYGIVYGNDFNVSSNNIIEYRPGHEGPVNTQVIVRDNLMP